jgi:hypothetical protein
LCFAAGYKVVGANGAVKWPYGKHSICGDDANKSDQPFMKPGPIVGEELRDATAAAAA